MAQERIEVMISSRCDDFIKAEAGKKKKLTDLRRQAKEKIQAMKLFGHETFICWIHEDEPAAAADETIWEKCLRQAGRCQILIMLYNGSAGYGLSSRENGICHAEMMEAMNKDPGKIRLIDVTGASSGKVSGDVERNRRFEKYLSEQNLNRNFAASYEQALDMICSAVHTAVVDLTKKASNGLRSSRYATGAPVEWSRMDFNRRKRAIEEILLASLGCRDAQENNAGCIHQIDGKSIFFRTHAIPAGMGVAAAREMVGRPFLRDHESLKYMEGDAIGPVHLIGCHKGVTENQAVSILGFPDATILTPKFGVYAVDEIQKIQLVFLANCRDESNTRNAVQQFKSWLVQIGEGRRMADRAAGRKAIITSIARQQPSVNVRAVGR
jgi:hypothetical protein